MYYFINYDANTDRITISTYRNTGYSGDIGDLAEAVEQQNLCVNCPLDGAKDTLEDGSYWNGMSISQETLETIHFEISQFEASNSS